MNATSQAYVDAVIAKCGALRAAGLWPSESVVRPRAWLGNFSADEQPAAAVLLDNFICYSEDATRRLLVGAFESAVRVPPTRKRHLSDAMLAAAVFTPVSGETPNLTDSGNTIARTVRKILEVPTARFVEPEGAISMAQMGIPIIFIDDFSLTGDQFVETWQRDYGGTSFAEIAATTGMQAACIYIVATEEARRRVESIAVPVSAAHTLDQEHRYQSLRIQDPPPHVPDAFDRVDALLDKYAPHLRFRADDSYMTKNPLWARNGYKERGLLFAFEGNVPDGSLPIFWADGPDGWTPLARRT